VICAFLLGSFGCSGGTQGATNQNNDQPGFCGDGVVDGAEFCDGSDLAGTSFVNLGFEGGFLSCGADCNFVTAGCEALPACGDGVLNAGEACDDGNVLACDGCSATCLVEACGDGVVECGEACDDGNTLACDGCSATCLVEACGDGVVECGEVCDDGNTVSGDGCSADCASTESCGNWIVDGVAGEVCDDGNTVSGDGCSANCRSDETCPNGVYDPINAESCDDGNGFEWDGCNTVCQCVEFQVNTYTTDDQMAPRVARAANGSFVVVWLSVGQDGSGRGIYAQRFDAGGNPLGVEFRANTYTTLDQGGPSIAMAPDGRFVVAWQSEGQDGSGHGVYAQRYDSGGVPQGSEFRLNTITSGTQQGVSVAMADDGSFVVTFIEDPADYDIKCRLFNASGVALANEFQVNTYGVGQQSASKVAMTSTGEFVVVWQSELQDGDGWGVFGQRFNATGANVGVEFQVSSTSVGDQRRPDVAMADDGSFMAVWVNGSLVTDDWDVFGRRFGIAGAPLGPDFQINTFTGMIDTYPYIDMVGDGRSVVTWPGPDTDGDAYGAYARYYDSNGLALGPEFLANLYTAGYQSWPFAAVNDDGGAWIFWHSGEQDGSQKGIFGRRFDSGGAGLCRGL